MFRKQDFNSAVAKALSAELPEDKIIRLDYVTFETGSATLTAESRYELKHVYDALNTYPKVTIEVAGHTDNTGDAEANQTLSQARAQAVYDYLTDMGVASDRMTPRGYGQDKPIDSNETEEGRQKNRRTEFQILTQ